MAIITSGSISLAPVLQHLISFISNLNHLHGWSICTTYPAFIIAPAWSHTSKITQTDCLSGRMKTLLLLHVIFYLHIWNVRKCNFKALHSYCYMVWLTIKFTLTLMSVFFLFLSSFLSFFSSATCRKVPSYQPVLLRFIPVQRDFFFLFQSCLQCKTRILLTAQCT